MQTNKLKIGIFTGTAGNKYKKDLMLKFAQGIKNHDVIISDNNNNIECDIGLMFSYFNPKNKKPIYRYNVYKNNKCRWIYLDSDPTICYNSKKNINFYRISLDSPYYDEGLYPIYNYDDKRWKKICQIKKIVIKPWRTEGDHILLLLQDDILFSTKGNSLEPWINETIAIIRKYSNRRIHVRYKKNTKKYKIIDPINNFTISYGKNSLLNDIENAWCAVHYSTTASLPCIINGIPIFCGDKSSIVYEVGNMDLSMIEGPKMPNREDFFNKMGYCLYGVKDFVDGIIWERIEYMLKE